MQRNGNGMDEELKLLQICLNAVAKVLRMDGKEGLCGFNGIECGCSNDEDDQRPC